MISNKNQKLLILLVSLVTILAVLGGWKVYSDKKIAPVFHASRQKLSVVALEHSKKAGDKNNKNSAQINTRFLQPRKKKIPSPLREASSEELTEFPGAEVMDAIEVAGPEKNQITRIRILETHFKYPYIRTEEVIDQQTGALVRREEMVANHLLVKLADGEDPQLFLMSFGPEATSINPVTPNGNLYQLNLKSSSLESLPHALDKIITIDGRETTSEPDFIGHIHLLPNDPAMYLHPRESSNFQWALYTISAPTAWNIRTSANDIIVALLDTGIRYTHEDLEENIWHNPVPTNNDLYGCNVISQALIPSLDTGDPMDDNGHGTHCAGIIGAVGNNGIGICGVAWNIQLMACKWLDAHGSGTESGAIYCINYASSHGANIINASWGSLAYSNFLYQAIQGCQQKNIIFVAAAGNSGLENNSANSNCYPASYDLDNIVSVAASSENDTLADFSDYGGNTVSLAAPGVNIYSTYNTSDLSFATMSGTSMAAPHVSGALALMMAQFPNASYQELIHKLLSSTDTVPALQGKVISGRLNLAKALMP